MPTDQLSQCAEYVAAVKPGVRESRYFELYLNRYDRTIDATTQLDNMGEAFSAAYSATLRPLLAKAKECRVYSLDGAIRADEQGIRDEAELRRRSERRSEWLAAYTRTSRSALDVDLSATGALDDVAFWWWLFGGFGHRAFPVILVDATALDPAVEFAPLLNPTAFASQGDSGRSAQRFAKKATAGGDLVAFLPGRTGYQASLGVIAEEALTEQLFEKAIAHCRLTPEFIWDFATYTVLPIEMGGYGVWIRMNSNQNDWTILTAALEKAERLGEQDVGALFEGLVAAELTASVFGKPPAVFSRLEPKRAAALAEWAARWAPRNPLAPETRALALRVVQQVAGIRALPQRLWRTEEPRALWYRALADLAQRLE